MIAAVDGSGFPSLTPETLVSCLNEKIGPTWQTLTARFPDTSQQLAAVVVPIVLRDQGWELLFIRRTLTVSHHPGQIAFPGGRADPDDPSPLATALRELQEELGIAPDQVEILGPLPTTRTLQSGFLIQPFLVRLQPDPILTPATDEVAATLFIPLNFFLEQVTLSPGIESFDHRGERIWGATARIMTQLSVAILTRQACAS